MSSEPTDPPGREKLRDTFARMDLRPGKTESTEIIVPPTSSKKHHWIHAGRHAGLHPSELRGVRLLGSAEFAQMVYRDPGSVCRVCWNQFFGP